MAKLKKIPHQITYDGGETRQTAQSAAVALLQTGSVSLSREELTELFMGPPGELPIDLTVVDAKLIEERFQQIGFGGRLSRVVHGFETEADRSPFVEFKRATSKAVSEEAIVGVITFAGVWLLLFLLSLAPLPMFGLLFFPGSQVVQLGLLSLLLSAGLAVTEGYLAGVVMSVWSFGWAMGLLAGIALAALRALCLAQSLVPALFQCIIGSMIVGADITLKKSDSDWLPQDWRRIAGPALRKPLAVFISAHVLVLAITTAWRLILK